MGLIAATVELRKNANELAGLNTGPVVDHVEPDSFAGARRSQLDRCAGRRIFRGIAKQIPQDLLNAHRIGPDHGFGLYAGGKRMIAGKRAGELDCLRYKRRERHGPESHSEIIALSFGHSLDVAHQHCEHIGLVPNRAKRPGLLFGFQTTTQEEIAISPKCRNRRSELMPDHRREICLEDHDPLQVFDLLLRTRKHARMPHRLQM